jgi:PAS domain S-box-containing protein
MGQALRILLVEDSEEDSFFLTRELRRAGFDPTTERVASAETMIAALDRGPWDIVISDYVLPGFGGLEALAIFKEKNLDVPFLLVSGHIGEDLAVAAMQAGADDYLMKDRLARLGAAVRRALERAEIRRAHKRSMEALATSEERFRQLAENIGAAFLMLEKPAGAARVVVSYVSPAYEVIWGLSSRGLFNDPYGWLQSVHADDRQRVETALPQLAIGIFDEEFRILRRQQEQGWVHFRTFPVHNEQGHVYRIAALAEDITERKHAEQRLRDSNEQLSLAQRYLEKRVMERTADLTAANAELQKQMKERRRLENELLEIAENERRRIGFDLHDDIGQKLMGVSLLLKALETNLRHKRLSQAQQAQQAHVLIEQVVNQTHDLAHCFSSMDDHSDDLPILLKKLIGSVRTNFEITCRLRTAGPLPKLASEATLQLYKIAQESISNAIKHGKATRIWIALAEENGEVMLQIKNDGKAFPEQCEPSNRLGLKIMDYRARTIGGRLDIRANGRAGTIVTCRIPALDQLSGGTRNFESVVKGTSDAPGRSLSPTSPPPEKLLPTANPEHGQSQPSHHSDGAANNHPDRTISRVAGEETRNLGSEGLRFVETED